jgi:cAMP phosphodiesterase
VKLRVLGCSGGELPKHRTTCFLLDEKLAVDAGALTGTLSLEELLKVDDILLTHSHFDHVKDVPLLADLIVGRRRRPVRIHASRECAETLLKSIFNDALWPDFTRIPSRRNPVLSIKQFDGNRPFKIGTFTVNPVPVRHPVESMGFVITNGESSIAVSGDTGPTTQFWRQVNETPNIKALLVEMSFPNKLQQLADVSGHLTPKTLALELTKVRRNGFPVLLYHLKPAYMTELRRDLAALRLRNVRILTQGEELKF